MRKSLLLLLSISGSIAAPAFASTTTGSLTVQANVQASCYLNTAAANQGSALLNFGTITNLQSNVNADAATSGSALSLICSSGTTYAVSADLGTNATGQQRQMANGSNHLPYNLYSDSARTTAITSGAAFASSTGTGLAQNINLWGAVPAGSTLPPPGSYVDTVTLTVTY